MSLCYRSCKHYSCGICTKYDEIVRSSKDMSSYGLYIHPFDYLTLYYDEPNKDIESLIAIADKYETDNTSKGIVGNYKGKKQISDKQKRYLLYKILHCYERKELK